MKSVKASLELSGSHSLTFTPRATATRIQVAQNVAVPATSLCINRRLYKIATAQAVKATKAEKRKTIIQDLLIGAGIPILQMVARECAYPFNINRLQGCNVEYIASANRYYIFEDYGPHFTLAFTPLTIILFHTWPVAIGIVSLYYCGEYPGSLLPFGVLAHWL